MGDLPQVVNNIFEMISFEYYHFVVAPQVILPTTWRSEVCKGIDPNAAASVLAKAGLLKRDSDGLQPKVSIPGEGRPRVYVLSGRILDEG